MVRSQAAGHRSTAMPVAPLKDCAGCHKAVARDTMVNGRCPTCAAAQGKVEYRQRKETDPFHEKYQTPDWRRLSTGFRAQNPMCLVLDENGQQCRFPSEAVHHRIAAKDREDLFFDPKNLAAICDHHHGHTPGDPAGVKYAPARYFLSYLPGQNLAEPNYSIAPPPPRASKG
jgi:hypothetical protein